MTFTSASDSFASGGRIPARAGGGPVMVGERGPELFIPHSSGVIRNNHDTMNMLGGSPQPVVNQTINIDTGVSQTVRAEVMSMMPRIKSETIQAMIDGKRRGNSISKAFA
jgi:phage-related minor tail protein